MVPEYTTFLHCRQNSQSGVSPIQVGFRDLTFGRSHLTLLERHWGQIRSAFWLK